MIVAVGGELLSLEIGFIFTDRSKILFCILQYRRDVFVILAGERLGRENDLMPGIDQSLGVVASEGRRVRWASSPIHCR